MVDNQRSDERKIFDEWFSERLTYEAFRQLSDEELTDDLVDWLTKHHIIMEFKP